MILLALAALVSNASRADCALSAVGVAVVGVEAFGGERDDSGPPGGCMRGSEDAVLALVFALEDGSFVSGRPKSNDVFQFRISSTQSFISNVDIIVKAEKVLSNMI